MGSDFLWENRKYEQVQPQESPTWPEAPCFSFEINGSVAQKLALEYMRLHFSIFMLQQSALVWAGKLVSVGAQGRYVSACKHL